MAVITKSNAVHLKVLTPALANILYKLEFFYRTYWQNVVPSLVITSINDGNHSPNSRHYTDEAIDVRSRNFPSEESKQLFRQELELFLGGKFRVLYENAGTDNEHFHIQVRKGMRFP